MAKGFQNGLKKVGRVWHFKFKMHGKLHHGSTRQETIQEARRILDKLRSEAALQMYGLSEPPTVKVVYEAYCRDKTTHIEERSMDSFKSTISHWVLPLIGHIRVDRIKASDLSEIERNYTSTKLPNGRSHSKGGMRATMIATRTLLNHAVKSGLVMSLPVRVRLPKLQKVPIQAISGKQLTDFLSTVRTLDGIPSQVALAIAVMLMMGLRISEVVGMRWEWFDSDMEFYTPGKTKGKEAEEIPVVPHLTQMLIDWKATCEVLWGAKNMPVPPWVFHSRGGEPQCKTFTTAWIRQAAETLKMPGKWSPHKLRASCATILNELGVNAFTIQKILRHKHIGTTLFYARTDRDAMRAGLQKLSDLAYPEEAKATPSVVATNSSSMSDQDLDAIRKLLPPGAQNATVRPLMLAGMSEAEAIITVLRQENISPAS